MLAFSNSYILFLRNKSVRMGFRVELIAYLCFDFPRSFLFMSLLLRCFWVALGSALGGGLRYLLLACFPHSLGQMPWATLGVNVLGCLVLGCVSAYWAQCSTHPSLLLLLSAGFCGGFTTFSTLIHEQHELFVHATSWQAAAYPFLTFGAGWLALIVGHRLVALWG